ncbi:MAG: hypothetical protein V4733_11345 [Verrucomicrobiota bacterium]
MDAVFGMMFRVINFRLIVPLSVLAVASCAAPQKAVYVPQAMAPGAKLWVQPQETPTAPVAKTKPAEPAAPETTGISQPVAVAPAPNQKGWFSSVFQPKPKEVTMEASTAVPEPVTATVDAQPEKKKGFFPSLFGTKEKQLGLADVEPLPAMAPKAGKTAANDPAPVVARKSSGDTLRPEEKPSEPSVAPVRRKPAPLPRESGSRLRLPNMLTLPDDSELKKSNGVTSSGSSGVTAKPPRR